jgi:hypothetical protein
LRITRPKLNYEVMKRKSIKLITVFLFILAASCDEPETIVTNYVHADGSVTRKIEMRNLEKKFKPSDLQIPFDSTWMVSDSIELNKKGDTTWIKRAEKLFKNVDDINLAYKSDSSADKVASRHAEYKKTFKWFNTEFRFSENIDKKLMFGYPVRDFLNDEELLYFYSPVSLKHEKEIGPDSLKFKALSDSVSKKTDRWNSKNLVSEWIGEFTNLTAMRAGNNVIMKSLKSHEDDFVKIIETNDKKLDSLWENGILLREFIGEENALKYKAEADTAIEHVTGNLFLNFKDYSVRISMPGKLIGTNGFIDSSKIVLWPVKSDYFMTEPYIMWAESKVTNVWAWIISGLFLVFVLAGIIRKVIKKG